MSVILSRTLRQINPGRVFWWCPGCKMVHRIQVPPTKAEPGISVWGYNNDPELPTFTPSVLVNYGTKVCHCFIRDGVIEFLVDSFHELKGQSVPLPEFPDEEDLWDTSDDDI